MTDDVKPVLCLGPTLQLPSGELLGLDDALMAAIDRIDTVADTLNVTDAATCAEAKAVAKQALATHNQFDKDRLELKAPYWESCKAIDAWAAPFLQRLKTSQSRLNAKLGAYAMAVEQQRQAAERARIQAEELAQKAPPLPGHTMPPLPHLPAVPPPADVPTTLRTDVRIVNPDLIPREYLVPDLRRIEADLKAGKIIPGVQLEHFRQVVTR